MLKYKLVTDRGLGMFFTIIIYLLVIICIFLFFSSCQKAFEMPSEDKKEISKPINKALELKELQGTWVSQNIYSEIDTLRISNDILEMHLKNINKIQRIVINFEYTIINNSNRIKFYNYYRDSFLIKEISTGISYKKK